jgi:L-ornithine N5-monooxygenase
MKATATLDAGSSPGDVLDVLGVGFGPSNLALAIALHERSTVTAAGRPPRALFIERQQGFGWHPGMLIDGANLRVSYLKDLVTMRDPTSGFSFLNYLSQTGRLPAFINKSTMYPSRVEFNDYLSWAARQLQHMVAYGLEVTGARPVLEDGDVRYLDVVAQQPGSGRPVTYRTRNVVVATGLGPRLPLDAPRSPRIWHSSELMQRLGGLDDDQEQTFVVEGAGQSAAETAEYLHRRFRRARVYCVFSRFGYSPADDSAFVNGIFDPASVDLFHSSPAAVRQLLLDYHANTNYSVVDSDLITTLYDRWYEETVAGPQRLIMRNLSRVAQVTEGGQGLEVRLQYLPDNSFATVPAHWLIYATGYRPRDPLEVLGEAGSFCKSGESGAVQVDRGYRVVTTGRMSCGIYVQGAAEATHGLASTLLSTVAVRAGEIAGAIEAATADTAAGGSRAAAPAAATHA